MTDTRKILTFPYTFLGIVLLLFGCTPAGSPIIPSQVESPVFSPTPMLSTSTPTSTFTATVTRTLPPTLEPAQAEETLKTLLQESVDCEAPCFWGITPGRTTLIEAINTFTHLGLQVNNTTYQGKDFYGIEYDFGVSLSISVVLTIQEYLVKNLSISIHPGRYSVGSSKKWSAYSPEMLISRYGIPSRVDFFLGRVAPVPTHSMQMYFEKSKLIVQYIGTKLLIVGPQLEICPITNQVEDIYIWMGDDPQYPPSLGVPLEEATTLTLEEFSKLMLGEPEKACFNLRDEAFPP
jgi:hypothetical protein